MDGPRPALVGRMELASRQERFRELLVRDRVMMSVSSVEGYSKYRRSELRGIYTLANPLLDKSPVEAVLTSASLYPPFRVSMCSLYILPVEHGGD